MGWFNDLTNAIGARSDREWHRSNSIDRGETTRTQANDAEKDYQKRLQMERDYLIRYGKK